MTIVKYWIRKAILTGLATNGLKPPKTAYAAIPSFGLGWLTTELAPQLLAGNLLDHSQHRLRGKQSKADLAWLGLSSALLTKLIWDASRSGKTIEPVLQNSLAQGYANHPADSRKATFTAAARPFKLNNSEVKVLRNLNYTKGGKRAKLDVYLPKRPLHKAPILIQIHGGGWRLGSKDEQGVMLMNRVAAAGWIGISANYRLAGKHPFPAQIIDVKKIIAWAREHATEYGGDPDYIVITGGSAGGHLSALAAVTANNPVYQPGFTEVDTSVAACVPFYGVYDLAAINPTSYNRKLRDWYLAPMVIKQRYQHNPEIFHQSSPITHVSPNTPDFFVVHGENDTLVSVVQSREFVKKLAEISENQTDYLELPGAQHAFEIFSSIRSEQVIAAVTRYLTWHHQTKYLAKKSAG